MPPRLLPAAVLALVLSLCALGGCGPSRNILDLKPPPDQPSLTQLEQHLDYVDPSAGRPNHTEQPTR